MQKRFAQKIEEMRRLIDDSRSASVSVGGEESHGGRKCATPLTTGGGTQGVGGVLSVTVASLSAPRYLLAVSGGMDSMCMADLFLQNLGTDAFSIAHCNFSLRGDESDGDEALVREWAENNGVRIFVKRFDTVAYAHKNGVSIEMAARDLRYSWFAQLCQDHGFSALSVAHNANDNAETLLLNLLRGTGLKGLHGMADISGTLPVVCRPLLEFTRKQIEGYVLTHRVPYRHDTSNFTSDYKRNRIRNEVFPIFEKINPSFIRTLNREIGYFSEAAQIVSDWCTAQLPEILAYNDDTQASDGLTGGVNISLSRLLTTPHWRYLLYHILEPYGFSSQVLASIENLLTSDRTIPGKRFESPTHLILTGRNKLTVLPREGTVEPVVAPDSSHEGNCAACGTDMPFYMSGCQNVDNDGIAVVRGAGIYNFNGSRFTVEILPWTAEMPLKQPAGVLLMDASKLRFPFVCRRWRQGDWFIPLGMKGRKKISDLFTDLKYDTLAKESAIIMVDTMTDGLAERKHVSGILGVRIDERYKITDATETVIRISL